MAENDLVVEVKGKLSGSNTKPAVDEIIKDFDTLTRFCDSYYKQGLRIVYNYSLAEVIRKLKGKFQQENVEQFTNAADKIIVLCKKSAEDNTERRLLSEVLRKVRSCQN